MGKKILNSKLLYIVLAILIAIALWIYVASVENTDGKTTISGIPITFLNEEVLEENGLMISDGRNQTATLTVTGPRTTLVRLNQEKENISLTVDVSRITSPGEQRMAFSYTLPVGYSNSVSVMDRSPSNIDFTVSQRGSQEIEVEGKFTGELAEGYMLGEFNIIPNKITVTGVESDVNQVYRAQVTVGGKDLSETVTGEMGFTLIGYQGEELTGLNVTCSTETVAVTLPVVKTAEVPLAVKLLPGGGVTDPDAYVTCEISPSSISVSGAEEDLEPLKEILLAEIDLTNIISTDTLEFEIPLNSSLNNLSGVTRAIVTVTIHGLETKTLDVDNIELINIPEGFDAEKVTQSVQVLVRGTSDAIGLVLPYNLQVVADLSEVGDAVGRYTVPAKISLNGTSDVGVVGSDYRIVVDVIVPTDNEE